MCSDISQEFAVGNVGSRHNLLCARTKHAIVWARFRLARCGPSAKPIGRCAALWVLWRSIVTGTSPPSTGWSQHHSGSAKWGRWVAVAPVVLYAVCRGLGDFFSRGRRTWVLVKKSISYIQNMYGTLNNKVQGRRAAEPGTFCKGCSNLETNDLQRHKLVQQAQRLSNYRDFI